MGTSPPPKKICLAKDAVPVSEEFHDGASSEGTTYTVYFTTELMARVATFASTSNSELMNICLAVGPVTSRAIKHDYLKRNVEYLQRTLRVFVTQCNQLVEEDTWRRARYVIRRSELAEELAKYSLKAGENHMAWMSINFDWKSNVQESLMEEFELVTSQITYPYIAFNNPAVAIQFGLMDVLEHLVEEKDIDINSLRWLAYRFKDNWYSSREPLLAYTTGHFWFPKQVEMYEYLLRRDDIDFIGGPENPELSIFPHAIDSGDDKFLRPLINHPRFNVNDSVAVSDDDDFNTPLIYVVLLLDSSSSVSFDFLLQALRMLVEAGADPNLVCPHVRLSPLDYATRRSIGGIFGPGAHWKVAVRILEGKEKTLPPF